MRQRFQHLLPARPEMWQQFVVFQRVYSNARVLRKKGLAGLLQLGIWSVRPTLPASHTNVIVEVVEYGVTLTECGGNIVCYNNSSCCTNGGPTYYVDPRTGEVKDGTNKDGINTSPPTYWDFGSTSTSLAAASSTLVSQSTSAFTASSPTGDTTLGPDTAQKSSSLSAGAGAGIGIGCAAAVAGLAVLGWVLLRRRRKNRVPQAQTDRPDGIFVHEYQDMGKTQPQSPTYHVHRNTQPQELDGGRRPQELQ
jgi:hypothetical protein